MLNHVLFTPEKIWQLSLTLNGSFEVCLNKCPFSSASIDMALLCFAAPQSLPVFVLLTRLKQAPLQLECHEAKPRSAPSGTMSIESIRLSCLSHRLIVHGAIRKSLSLILAFVNCPLQFKSADICFNNLPNTNYCLLFPVAHMHEFAYKYTAVYAGRYATPMGTYKICKHDDFFQAFFPFASSARLAASSNLVEYSWQKKIILPGISFQ